MKNIDKTKQDYEVPQVEVLELKVDFHILEGTNVVIGPDPEYPD